jgi:hypothetical protein
MSSPKTAPGFLPRPQLKSQCFKTLAYRLSQGHGVGHVEEVRLEEGVDPRDLCTHIDARFDKPHVRGYKMVYLPVDVAHVLVRRASKKLKPHPKSAHQISMVLSAIQKKKMNKYF